MRIVLVYIDHDVVAVVIVVNRCAFSLLVQEGLDGTHRLLAQGLGPDLAWVVLALGVRSVLLLLRLDLEVAQTASAALVAAGSLAPR